MTRFSVNLQTKNQKPYQCLTASIKCGSEEAKEGGVRIKVLERVASFTEFFLGTKQNYKRPKCMLVEVKRNHSKPLSPELVRGK
jgi:hypothetical protein